jgi:hypoxanthine phosphoribosyltransferase
METITIHDKKFRLYIPSDKIESAISSMAKKINHDLRKKEVVFLVVLNGAFMFATDLLRRIDFRCRISFVKMSSYEGNESTGQVKELIGINEVLKDKTVVVVEDIVDSGNTLNDLQEILSKQQPAEIRLVSLLFKPDAFEYNYKIDYVGFKIPNNFIVGYGLDYDGFGRNLKDIYAVVEL